MNNYAHIEIKISGETWGIAMKKLRWATEHLEAHFVDHECNVVGKGLKILADEDNLKYFRVEDEHGPITHA